MYWDSSARVGLRRGGTKPIVYPAKARARSSKARMTPSAPPGPSNRRALTQRWWPPTLPTTDGPGGRWQPTLAGCRPGGGGRGGDRGDHGDAGEGAGVGAVVGTMAGRPSSPPTASGAESARASPAAGADPDVLPRLAPAWKAAATPSSSKGGSMTRFLPLVAALAWLAAGTASAGDFDGSKLLICAPVEAIDCAPGEDCTKGRPDDIGAPSFCASISRTSDRRPQAHDADPVHGRKQQPAPPARDGTRVWLDAGA